MHKNIAAALTALTLVFLPATAEQLSPEESLARFAAMQNSAQHIQGVSNSGLTLQHTASAEGKNLYYVFTRSGEEGFVILSADDVVTPLLGYSDTGTFDIGQLPPNFLYWLDEYKSAISGAISGERSLRLSPAKAQRTTIAPMVTTTWGQGQEYNGDHIYNKYCPVINNKYCVTGCVATAMAQLMNFFRWPNKGVGSKSYVTETHNKSLSANFGTTTYQWSSMQDHYGTTWYTDKNGKYTADFTSNANIAVSRLMYHCGIAAEMDYGPEASGARDHKAIQGLVKYFDYNPHAYLALRNYYSDDEWEELLYNQLADQHPVIYTGRTSKDEGHAFICDGYKNGLFHINWGWNGLSDGYYTIMGTNALHPTIQGTGGSYSSEAYNSNHCIYADLTKPADAPTPYYCFAVSENYKVLDYNNDTPHLTNGNYLKIVFDDGVFSHIASTVKARPCLHLTNINSGKSYYLDKGGDYVEIGSYKGYSQINLPCQSIPDGVYEAVPCFKCEGTTQMVDARIPTDIKAPLVAVGNAEIPVNKADAELCCSTISITDGGNNSRVLHLHVTNPGNVSEDDFDGHVAPGLIDDDGKLCYVFTDSKQAFDMPSMKYNSNTYFDFSVVIPSSIADGHYQVAFCGFQKNSTNWTAACYLDPTSIQFDRSKNTTSDFWLSGSTISTTAPVTKPDAELCCSTISLTDGGNGKRTLNLHVTNPGNVSEEDFEGHVAPALLTDDGSIVYVFADSKQAFDMPSMKYSSSAKFDFSVVIPSNIADGHYRVAFCGFQTGSSNWTTACYLNPTSIKIDRNKKVVCDIWLQGNTVAATDIVGIESIYAPAAPHTDIYDLSGRRTSSAAHKGISIEGGRKVIR